MSRFRLSVSALLLSALFAAPAFAQSVLIVEAIGETYRNDVVAKLNGAGVASVDLFDARVATPTPLDLDGYDAVMVISDNGFADNVALGDLLADYVDAGGALILTVFTFWDASEDLGIGGRLSTGGYLPFTQGSQSSGTELTLVPIDAGHPLLAGVSSFSGGSSSYHNSNLTVASGATLVAEWSNGEPLIGFLGSVVGLNFYPPSGDARQDFWDVTTDGAQLLANSVSFAAGLRPPQEPSVPVPTLSTWSLIALFMLMMLVAGTRLRRQAH